VSKPAPTSPPAAPSTPTYARVIIVAMVALLSLVVVRTAWLSEDAYFTYRCVDNWVHGFGARWNVLERVQVYTHPLWFGLMSALFFVTRDMTLSGFALGFVTTAATAWVLIRGLGRSWQGTVLALGCLIGSKAFTDYSTSGLENPLSHLLLLGFFAQFFALDTHADADPRTRERQLLTTSLIGGLLVCNRMDLGLMLIPALIYALWPPRLSLRRVLIIGLGFSPLIVWELISLIYYGFLVPNTAYAKLGASLPRELVVKNGVHYFKNSLDWDPLTLVCIALVTGVCLAQLRRRPRQACAALGVLLYLGYVLNIGGGYMSGRFFSAPLAVAAGLIASQPKPSRPVFVVAALAILGLTFKAPAPTVLAGKDYDHKTLGSDGKIDDERGYRHIFAGLISERETEFLANSSWYLRGERDKAKAEANDKIVVATQNNGGYMGYAAGPFVHYINPYGITDPLLARLPGKFRGPGHIWRRPPAGYARAVVGAGELDDPNLDAYWRELALIVRGPIWSRQRWRAIWRMHKGDFEPLVDAYVEREQLRRQRKLNRKLDRPAAQRARAKHKGE